MKTAAVWNAVLLFGIIMLFAGSQTSAGNLADRIDIRGDFRFRHDVIDREGFETRARQRLRLRLWLDGTVSDQARVRVRLLSGTEDPLANNESLGDGWSNKEIVLDHAYFELKPKALPGLMALGGKFPNPFERLGGSELIWWTHLRMEGLSFAYGRSFDRFSVKAITGGLWLEERGNDDDSYLAAGQAILSYKDEDTGPAFTAGVGVFNYINTRGYLPFYDTTRFAGNSIDDAGRYLLDYNLVELFASTRTHIADFPLLVFFDYVTNTATDSNQTGWLAGLQCGQLSGTGSWSMRAYYRELEKDAVLGGYTDSNFGGGGTDNRGVELDGSLRIMHNITLSLKWFDNRMRLNDEQTYRRFLADLKFSF